VCEHDDLQQFVERVRTHRQHVLKRQAAPQPRCAFDKGRDGVYSAMMGSQTTFRMSRH
jgi:hypothetical protein